MYPTSKTLDLELKVPQYCTQMYLAKGRIEGSNCYQVTQCDVGVSAFQDIYCSCCMAMAHAHIATRMYTSISSLFPALFYNLYMSFTSLRSFSICFWQTLLHI